MFVFMKTTTAEKNRIIFTKFYRNPPLIKTADLPWASWAATDHVEGDLVD